MHTSPTGLATRSDIPSESIRIRPIDRFDAGSLAQLYADLSADSRAWRFLGDTAGLSLEACYAFCMPASPDAEGFVAELKVAGPDEGRLVGHVSLEPADAGALRLGIVVADAFQRRGIGRRLLVEALRWARAHNSPSITATALAANAAFLSLLDSLPEKAQVRPGPADLMTVHIPLSAARERAR